MNNNDKKKPPQDNSPLRSPLLVFLIISIIATIVLNLMLTSFQSPHSSEIAYNEFLNMIEAGATRMRPVMMTSLTTILGLVVMAVGKTAGTDMMQPIALVSIGGLIYATIMTLFVVPVIYDLFNGEKYKMVREEDVDVSDLVVE